MKTKSLGWGFAAVAGCIVAGLVLHRPHPTQKSEPAKPQTVTQVAAPVVLSTESNSPPAPAVEETPAGSIAQTPIKPAVRKPTAPASPPENQEPDARAALSLVGIDPDAEQYWAEAIFDPNRSDKEREDLMEDLNEEGFADPQNPGPDDLPLIVNRLRIIEAVAPDADEFMVEHLAEAYKDLAEMYARAAGRQ
jgi:hypothetical protein